MAEYKKSFGNSSRGSGSGYDERRQGSKRGRDYIDDDDALSTQDMILETLGILSKKSRLTLSSQDYSSGYTDTYDLTRPIEVEKFFKLESQGQGNKAWRLTTTAHFSSQTVSSIDAVINNNNKGGGKVERGTPLYGYTQLFKDARREIGNRVLELWEIALDTDAHFARKDENGRLPAGWDKGVFSQERIENGVRDSSIFHGETHPLSRLAIPTYDCMLGPQFSEGALIRRVFESIIVRDIMGQPSPIGSDERKHESKSAMDIDTKSSFSYSHPSSHPSYSHPSSSFPHPSSSPSPPKLLTYVSLGSGALFEDLAIIDQLIKSGKIVNRVILIDKVYGNLSYNTLDGNYKFIPQFMTWFNSYPQIRDLQEENKFQVLVYSDFAQYLNDVDISSSPSLKADLFIVADIHFTLGSQPQLPPFADLSSQSTEKQFDETRNAEIKNRIATMNHKAYRNYPFDEKLLKRVLKQDSGKAYWLANQIVKLPVQFKEFGHFNFSTKTVQISPKPEIHLGIVSVFFNERQVLETRLQNVEKLSQGEDEQQDISWNFAVPRPIDIKEWVIL